MARHLAGLFVARSFNISNISGSHTNILISACFMLYVGVL